MKQPHSYQEALKKILVLIVCSAVKDKASRISISWNDPLFEMRLWNATGEFAEIPTPPPSLRAGIVKYLGSITEWETSSEGHFELTDLDRDYGLSIQGARCRVRDTGDSEAGREISIFLESWE